MRGGRSKTAPAAQPGRHIGSAAAVSNRALVVRFGSPGCCQDGGTKPRRASMTCNAPAPSRRTIGTSCVGCAAGQAAPCVSRRRGQLLTAGTGSLISELCLHDLPNGGAAPQHEWRIHLSRRRVADQLANAGHLRCIEGALLAFAST